MRYRRRYCRALKVQVQENGRTHVLHEDSYVKKQQSLTLEKVSGDAYFILMYELCLMKVWRFSVPTMLLSLTTGNISRKAPF